MALKLLTDMKKQSIHPNVITYATAISTCKKSKIMTCGMEAVG